MLAGAGGLAVLCVTAVAAAQSRGAVSSAVQHSDPAPYVVPAKPLASVAAPSQAPGRAGPQVSGEWVRTTAANAGIPEPAIRAYAAAQLHQPAGCGLNWTTLAGIGYVESLHGTLGGRQLLADGHSDTAIVGPALDGTGGNQAMPASAAGVAWHGDTQWEHAVGPLQFLPSTWDRWGGDGDGDGIADPTDIDDAALAAARYLCADGYDFSDPAQWAAAVFGYNHAQSYVDSVYAAASAYAERTR